MEVETKRLLNERAILSKVCQPHNFESCNSPKLSFTNIQGLHSMNVNLSLNNSPDILVLFEANLDHMIDSSNFLMTDFFNRKNYVTHTPGLPAYVKEGLSYL